MLYNFSVVRMKWCNTWLLLDIIHIYIYHNCDMTWMDVLRMYTYIWRTLMISWLSEVIIGISGYYIIICVSQYIHGLSVPNTVIDCNQFFFLWKYRGFWELLFFIFLRLSLPCPKLCSSSSYAIIFGVWTETASRLEFLPKDHTLLTQLQTHSYFETRCEKWKKYVSEKK